MSQLTFQLNGLIALYVLCGCCHGGITTINCSGNIWVEPATVLHVGTSVSIYCRAVIKNCQPRKLNFYKNGFKESDKITEINRTTARLSYENFLEPHISVYCTAQCPGHLQETVICGKDIFSGYPPDAPDEVMCVIYEYSGHMTCTWNTGRLTHLDTKYVVHVKSLETEEEQQYVTASYANISTDSLQGGRKYLVWVQAVNALGMAESPQLQVHLDDIVIPSASIISSAETIDATVANTIIHWNSKTMIEKVSCEMRYKATTNQTWSVKEFDTNFTHVQQTDFYLEPNIKYEFQVRCQETGKRYWQPWSSPFVYRTPETVPQVTPKSSRGDAQNSGMPTATVFKRYLTSDKSQDIRLLSGMVFLAIILPTISLIGIFNRSLRRGIKRKILLLIPKWLHEDIPNMENSNAVKMLQSLLGEFNKDLEDNTIQQEELIQEKNVFVYSNASEDALSVDPVITEISEIFLPAHKPTDYKEEKLMVPLETRDCLQASLSTSSIVYIPDLNAGYKPQISSFHPGENHLNPSYEADSTPDLPSHFCGLGNIVRLKMYPRLASSVSSMNSLSNTLVFEELSLLLNRGECNSPDTQNSGEEETTMFLESDSSKDTLPEQTLLPDEFVSCLATGSEALSSINSYFPQNILESHFSEISLLQK